jgi:hypothetical protein
MKTAKFPVILMFLCALAAASAGCDGDARDGGDAGADIGVGAAQEQAMCDVLSATVGTGPIPVQASADLAGAPGMSAQPGKKPVTLTAFEGQNGGYVRLTLEPALATPVLLMLDEAIPFAAVREDGAAVDLHDAADGSELCPIAGGRYTWFVSGSTNYLRFGPTEHVSFNVVLEPVD